jgi:signal transduction histidine kinase/CheY-like chemotaxis protein
MADLGAERRAREQSEVKADTRRRERRESRERADLRADTGRRERRESRERADLRADTERRERRESHDRPDLESDTERRERRESLERSDVKSDTGRRERRESLERSDVESHTGRRERRESAERKNQQQAQLLQAQRLESLGQLAGGVAHDFNNLLAVILSYASFVSEELASPSGPDWPERLDSARSDLRQITLAAERAAGLTRQLLSFARREVVRPQVLDLGDVVIGVQELLHRTLGEHIELITTLADDLWPVLADPGQLEQVLVNLAVNARDAMPGGGTLTIDTSNISVDATAVAGGSPAPLGKNVRLRISDTGVGIPADVLEHVFEPFFTTKEEGSGTGLGLATVYGILVQAGGQIQIYTEPAIGTTFTITMPVTAQALVPLAAPVLYRRTPKGETVLVVEDEEALRLVTQRIFTRNGYHVITAADGPAALEIARAHPGEIHLLVTDVVMPRMLGKEVAERMRAIKPGIKVLFMSGYARPVLASQGSLEPHVALVEKPFSESQLLSQAAKVLNGHFPGFKTVDGTD